MFHDKTVSALNLAAKLLQNTLEPTLRLITKTVIKHMVSLIAKLCMSINPTGLGLSHRWFLVPNMGMERRRLRLIIVITGLFGYSFFLQASGGPPNEAPIKELTLAHNFPPLPPTTECVPFKAFPGRSLRLCVKSTDEDAVVSANIQVIVSQTNLYSF